MADRILHFEVTRGYGKVKEGLRFDVFVKGSDLGPRDLEIEKGLAEAADISMSEAKTARCNMKYEEI